MMPAPLIDKGMKGETHDGPKIRFIVVTLGLVFVLVVFVVAVFTFGSASDVTTTVTSVGGVVASTALAASCFGSGRIKYRRVAWLRVQERSIRH
jgi:hypothetical protein